MAAVGGITKAPLAPAPTPQTSLFNKMGAQTYAPYVAPTPSQSVGAVNPAPAAPRPLSAPTGPATPNGGVLSMEAINNVVTPKPPQQAQSGQTNDALAGLMGGMGGQDTPQILGSQDQILRPLGQRMLPMQSMDVAQRGKRVY